MDAKTITLKALVDKVKNKIIYVESEGDFVDVLFSFLTMPLGTIIRITRNHPPITKSSCIGNLYASVENLDARYLRTEACRTMLLNPRSAAAEHCKSLKVQIDDTDSVRYFLCEDPVCKHKLKCRYNNASCPCGRLMNREEKLWGTAVSNATVGQLGFVPDIALFVISDDLEVRPMSTVSLLSKHGVQDFNSLEERTFQIGADEVLNILKLSWMSRTPLTDVLLQNSTTGEVSVEHIGQVGYVKHEALLQATEEQPAPVHNDSKIAVKLIISKSKQIVCYAEGEEDFVDLLFSFLTVTLGHVFKEPQGACSNGSLRNLYKSVHDLDAEKYLISKAKKDILCNVKLPKWFGFSDNLLGLEEEAGSGSKKLQNRTWVRNGAYTNDPVVSSTMGCDSLGNSSQTNVNQTSLGCDSLGNSSQTNFNQTSIGCDSLGNSSQMNVNQTSLCFGRVVPSTNYFGSYKFGQKDSTVPDPGATNSGSGFIMSSTIFRGMNDMNVTNYIPCFIEMDPKVHNAEGRNRGKGFTRRPAMFRVTDDLNVTPAFLSSGLSIFKKLQVLYDDLEERTVLIGKEEALSLLFAAFNNSACALTEAFLSKSQAQNAKRKRDE